MGDTQSKQAEPQANEQARPRQKPWSPADISESSDEEEDTTELPAPSPSRAGPNPSSNSARGPRVQTKQLQSRRRRNDAHNSQQEGADHVGVETIQNDKSRARSPQASPSGTEEAEKDSSQHQILSVQPKPRAEMTQVAVEPSTDGGIQNENLPEGLADHPVTHTEAGLSSSQSRPKGKAHTAQYSCPNANTHACDKTFATERSAVRHAQIHSDNKDLQCPVCAKPFARADRLKQHQLTHSRAEINSAMEQRGPPKQGKVTADEAIENSLPNAGDMDALHEESIHTTAINEPDTDMEQNVGFENGAQEEHLSETSTQPSTNIVDESAEVNIVQETPKPRHGLKRKRGTENVNMRQGPTLKKKSRKRMRLQSLSPPTSVMSDVQDDNTPEPKDNTTRRKPIETSRNSQSKSAKTGNLDNFAKPWTPGAPLYHPIHNPKSPKIPSSQSIEVAVPRTLNGEPSQKSMTRPMREEQSASADSGEDQEHENTPSSKKRQKLPYTSPKGKRKAERGVEYSSPSPEIEESDRDSSPPEPQGLATSVARRTMSNSVDRSQPNTKKSQTNQAVANKRKRNGSGEGKDSANNQAKDKPFACHRCAAKFMTEKSLKTHTRRIHGVEKDHKCKECGVGFPTKEALENHQQSDGHGDQAGYQGRKGAFSPGEIKKLTRWRDNFCDEMSINVPTFNQMMTDSCRRVKTFQWPYRFITKSDLLEQYYDILPGRNRRSMHRYRERAFQNVPEKQEWTEEDDRELSRLVREIGPKWVEIGQLMTRTQDSVNQRWRHKLQYKGQTNQGEWSPSEEERLREAVQQVKQEAGMSADVLPDARVPWDSVSKKMKGMRTAQQCSNKWRLLHLKRDGTKFVKPSEIDLKAGSLSSVATPSKMSQRLSGQTPSSDLAKSSTKNKRISDKYVKESSDDDDEAQIEQPNGDIPPSSPPRVRNTHKQRLEGSQTGQRQVSERGDVEVEVEPESPDLPRNLLPTRTPRNGHSLSQAFAQTQANTSAFRVPTTTRRSQTQPEMPTPGLPIHHRPKSSSSMQMLQIGNKKSKADDIERSKTRKQASQVSNGAVTAELGSESESSEEAEEERVEIPESEAAQQGLIDDEASDTDGEQQQESSSASQSTSSSDSESSSEAGDSDSDSMVDDTHKDSFIQSLQSPTLGSLTGSQARVKTPARRTLSRSDWENVVRGGVYATQDESESDSGNDSRDEGDIMHH